MEEGPNLRESVSTSAKRLLGSFDENVVVNAVEGGTQVHQTEQRDFTAITSGINVCTWIPVNILYELYRTLFVFQDK